MDSERTSLPVPSPGSSLWSDRGSIGHGPPLPWPATRVCTLTLWAGPTRHQKLTGTPLLPMLGPCSTLNFPLCHVSVVQIRLFIVTLQNLFEVSERRAASILVGAPRLGKLVTPSPMALGKPPPHLSKPPTPLLRAAVGPWCRRGVVSLGTVPQSASSLNRHGPGEPCVSVAHF